MHFFEVERASWLLMKLRVISSQAFGWRCAFDARPVFFCYSLSGKHSSTHSVMRLTNVLVFTLFYAVQYEVGITEI